MNVSQNPYIIAALSGGPTRRSLDLRVTDVGPPFR